MIMIMVVTSVQASIECMLWILIFFFYGEFLHVRVFLVVYACADDKSINAKYERQ